MRHALSALRFPLCALRHAICALRLGFWVCAMRYALCAMRLLTSRHKDYHQEDSQQEPDRQRKDYSAHLRLLLQIIREPVRD